MIQNWSEFASVFSVGLALGCSVGLLSLAVRRVRFGIERGFRSSFGSGF